MNEKAKIHLSNLEMELVNNTEWIFTKQKIITKVATMFGELHTVFKNNIEHEKNFLPAILLKTGGKISKGEFYKGLPYLILDYPSSFLKENIFAIRTMFWWGNFFSISLHLSGDSFSAAGKISEWLDYFTLHEFFVCVNESEWEHHFEPSNFISINENNHEELKRMANKSFFKVAKKIEVSNWDYVPEFLEESFRVIIEFIKINFPGDEKAL
jgi:hypothetical protein